MAGRKSLRDEIEVLRRYAELSVPYFKFISEMLAPESDKEDRKWAAERLDKAFPKMIPQNVDLTSGGEVIPILSGLNVSANNSNQEDSQPNEAHKSDTGRDISIENNLDTASSD